jgi:FtsP/CotA-like multicopper oxidase with cupredoxin domain
MTRPTIMPSRPTVRVMRPQTRLIRRRERLTGSPIIVMSVSRPTQLSGRQEPEFRLTLRAKEEANVHQEPETPPVLDQSFPTDPTALPEATAPQVLKLADGDQLNLRVAPVAKRLRHSTVRMLAYNGSIPGPTLHVHQGSELIVNVTNDGDLDTTVHWHGLRLENKYEGVPRETQQPDRNGAHGLCLPDARGGHQRPAGTLPHGAG